MTQPVEPAIVGTELTLTRVFDAPRSLVFRAWTDPAMIARWWGPNLFTAMVHEADARCGGAIRIDMRAPDGTVHTMIGEYRELVEPERLVFVSAVPDAGGRALFEVLNIVTLAEHDRGTALTLTARVIAATPQASQFIAGMEEGWSQSLARLAVLVAAPGDIVGGFSATAGDSTEG